MIDPREIIVKDYIQKSNIQIQKMANELLYSGICDNYYEAIKISKKNIGASLTSQIEQLIHSLGGDHSTTVRITP